MARVNALIVALFIIFGIPFYWYFINNTATDEPPKPIDIAQLRYLAEAGSAAGPSTIRFERVSSYERVSNRVAAGTGLRSVRLVTLAFLLEYENAPPVLIGGGVTRSDAATFGQEQYSPEAQARITRAAARARALVPLAPVPDQLGALKLLDDTRQKRRLSADVANQQRRDRAGKPYGVAPGVVIIPTPEASAGTRIVYVRLANGREYIFAGNLAQTPLSWQRVRLPARFVTDIGRLEDRGAIRSWLLTVRNLRRQVPSLQIVAGNTMPDSDAIVPFFEDGVRVLPADDKANSLWSFGPGWSNARANASRGRAGQDGLS